MSIRCPCILWYNDFFTIYNHYILKIIKILHLIIILIELLMCKINYLSYQIWLSFRVYQYIQDLNFQSNTHKFLNLGTHLNQNKITSKYPLMLKYDYKIYIVQSQGCSRLIMLRLIMKLYGNWGNYHMIYFWLKFGLATVINDY